MCSFWKDNYVGARDHNGKDCYGYMDYRDDTDEWSECSVNDFASYVNRQSNFCLQKIEPSSTDISDKGFVSYFLTFYYNAKTHKITIKHLETFVAFIA